uniref:Uncharacterized protein LOC104216887 n=1 Tax=Nicotiana sylvestris TaxID=4096 RepID=A0A1U7VG45_NICSY|nr:PREDICTED: uncharacterized protein LOC104216887 [Nicotiana sylvestris]
MDNGDKSWMNLLRWTDEYIRGVNDFLDKAFERAAQGNEILCPCKKCMNRYWYYRNVVEDHLVVHGFVDGYTKWVFHGEGFSSRNTPHSSNDDEGSTMRDDIDGLLHDTFSNDDEVCSAWRKYKSQLKITQFTAYENDELRMENRLVDIRESHFKDLLKY